MKNIVKMALLTATTFATIPAYAADCKVTGGLKSADSCAKVFRKRMVVQQACLMEIRQFSQQQLILCSSLSVFLA